jgi:hypothetical protein
MTAVEIRPAHMNALTSLISLGWVALQRPRSTRSSHGTHTLLAGGSGYVLSP